MLLPSQIAIPSGIDDSLFATAKQLFKQLPGLDKQINGGRELCNVFNRGLVTLLGRIWLARQPSNSGKGTT